MATLLEFNLIAAVQQAEMTRQVAKASALATYTAAGFTPAALATYAAALVTADIAYWNAVATASSTAGITFNSGITALFGGNWATIAK